MKVSCARSSAISRSRTIRKIREKTGRSYRDKSSRYAASDPFLACSTTAGSERPDNGGEAAPALMLVDKVSLPHLTLRRQLCEECKQRRTKPKLCAPHRAAT